MRKSKRKLKVWNGRGYGCHNYNDKRWKSSSQSVHAYVCAYSMADACRVIGEYCGRDLSYGEIKVYWSKDCWGVPMDGIKRERGLWLQFAHNEKPVRVTGEQAVSHAKK